MIPNGNESLTGNQRRAVAMLAAGRKVADAASAAGVSENTIMRWQRLPEFRQAVNELQADMIGAAVGRLTELQEYAVATIAQVMADKGNPPSVRLRAAVAVLDCLLRMRDSVTLEQRIQKLEQMTDAEA